MRRVLITALLSFYFSFLIGQIKKVNSGKTGNQKIESQANFLQRLGKEASDSIPSLGAFLVWQHGTTIYEGYFHGATPQTGFNIKSVTKTIVSAIAGIAKGKRSPTRPKHPCPFYSDGICETEYPSR